MKPVCKKCWGEGYVFEPVMLFVHAFRFLFNGDKREVRKAFRTRCDWCGGRGWRYRWEK